MKDDRFAFALDEIETPRSRISIAGLTWELLLVTLVFGAPRARACFADYGIPLSFFTVLILATSKSVIAYAPQLLALLGAVWLAHDTLIARRETRASRGISGILSAIPVLLLALTLIALGLPLLDVTLKLKG
jgi:hypothetical protein